MDDPAKLLDELKLLLEHLAGRELGMVGITRVCAMAMCAAAEIAAGPGQARQDIAVMLAPLLSSMSARAAERKDGPPQPIVDAGGPLKAHAITLTDRPFDAVAALMWAAADILVARMEPEVAAAHVNAAMRDALAELAARPVTE